MCAKRSNCCVPPTRKSASRSAEFFPKIGLTAFLGKISPQLSAFTLGGANAWGVAAEATGPLFEGGRLVGQYRQAKAARDEARLRYQQTALTALRDVSDALVSRERLGEIANNRPAKWRRLERAVRTSTERYLAGKASYYEVLEAQQQLFPRNSIWPAPSAINNWPSSRFTRRWAAAGGHAGGQIGAHAGHRRHERRHRPRRTDWRARNAQFLDSRSNSKTPPIPPSTAIPRPRRFGRTPTARWIFWWRRWARAAPSRAAWRSSSRARPRFRPSRWSRRIRRSFRNVWPASRSSPARTRSKAPAPGSFPRILHLKDSKGHPQIVRVHPSQQR
jgi:hypothetical protein